MRYPCVIIFTVIASVVAVNCKKDSGLAFDHTTMRPWFDKNCKSCHGSGARNSSAWTYNPDDYESSLKKHASHLYQVVYTYKSMPPSGLAQAELDQFKAWFDAGYPAR